MDLVWSARLSFLHGFLITFALLLAPICNGRAWADHGVPGESTAGDFWSLDLEITACHE